MAESSLQRSPPILLDRHKYHFKDILRCKPLSAWKYCTQLQEKWKADYSKDAQLKTCMDRWKESKSLHLVWVSDNFGGTLSGAVSEKRTYVLLTKLYKEFYEKYNDDLLKTVAECGVIISVRDGAAEDDVEKVPDGDRNAEKNRTSERQLKQHLEALVFLSRTAEDGYSLSENIIRYAHQVLMHGLHTSDGLGIHAGIYRTCPVSSDNHVFPHSDTIPTSMSRMVSKYNDHHKKLEHDPFELASWLLYEFLTIHPFEDGNGRVSRLLWCFSLMLEGLPFPLTPFPGTKRAYKQYVSCIEKDREDISMTPTSSAISCRFTTSLTVISVNRSWKNFISNLKQESPQRHAEMVKWLEEKELL